MSIRALLGFVVTSTYPRIEHAVGRRMGGSASHDELYRIFAGPFLVVGSASLLYGVLTKFIEKPGVVSDILLAIPSAVLIIFAARNYWSNLIASQSVTRARGSALMAITILLFIILILGCGAAISLAYRYGASEGIKAI